MKQLCLFAVGALLVLVCDLPAALHAQSSGDSVSGSLTYRERIALPENATIRVVLSDVSLADAPETVLVEQSFQAAGKQPPFDFSLSYDPSQIEENRSYAVRAEITVDGQLWFTTTSHYGVITQGNPTSGLALVLERTSSSEGASSTPPSNLPQTGGSSSLLSLLVFALLVCCTAGLALRRVSAR
jgi:putative lipoprotein